jgi:hypothetical protein
LFLTPYDLQSRLRAAFFFYNGLKTPNPGKTPVKIKDRTCLDPSPVKNIKMDKISELPEGFF